MHWFSSRSAAGAAMTRRATRKRVPQGLLGVLMQYAEEPLEAQRSQLG